jgi:hypothetical protein
MYNVNGQNKKAFLCLLKTFIKRSKLRYGIPGDLKNIILVFKTTRGRKNVFFSGHLVQFLASTFLRVPLVTRTTANIYF